MSEIKLFGTDGIRSEFGQYPMDIETIVKLGGVLGSFYRSKKILIGRDPRFSGLAINHLLKAQLLAQGVNVYDVGVVSTPALAYLVKDFADLGIMLTASHNPYNENGFKFFNSDGYKMPPEWAEEITQAVLHWNLNAELPVLYYGNVECKYIPEYMEEYLAYLLNIAPKNIGQGLNIVLDTSNGSLALYAKDILEQYGFHIVQYIGSDIYQKINYGVGVFYTDIVKEYVKENDADYGIVFDGDGDRLILLNANGEYLGGDVVLAVLGHLYETLGKFSNEKILVTTPMTNWGIIRYLEERGFEVHLAPVGDQFVAQELRRHNALLGAEESGHIILAEYSYSGDALLASLLFFYALSILNIDIQEILERRFARVVKSIRVRNVVDINEIEEYNSFVQRFEKEVRFFVRYSGTEKNVLRILIEAKSQNLANQLMDDLLKILESSILFE